MSGAGSRLVLWVAQGFGVGRIPFAPGTWGALQGLPWTWIVLSSGGLGYSWILTLAGVLAAVPFCAAGEKILGQRDPGSVVLDEIVVLPLVWLPALSLSWMHGAGISALITHPVSWSSWGGGFIAFRVFDIWKPGPIRRIQELPGGWGVVADDVLAALAAGLVPVLIQWNRG